MGYDRNDRRYGYERSPEYGGRRDTGRSDQDRGGYGDPRERGFFERAGDEVRSWFGDEEAERRRRYDEAYDDRYDRDRGYGEDRGYGQDRGGYARSSRGGYAGPDRYPNWARSNQDEGRRGGYARGYQPTSSYYPGAGEDRQFDDSYNSYGDRSFGSTGYSYADRDRQRREDEYRATYGSGSDRSGGAGSRSYGSAGYQDPHGYHSWRERQLASFDQDYDEYRREHQSRFESEFATWRQNRQTQRDSLNQVKEHQEVVGSDGTHVGTVDHVRGDRILLTKTDRDAGGHHHSIPSSWIQSVGDQVKLSKTAAEAQQAWRDEERNSGLFGRDNETSRDTGTSASRSYSSSTSGSSYGTTGTTGSGSGTNR